MKRLYDSSRGRLVLSLELVAGEVSASLFDGEGRVAREACDEWDNTDLLGLLRLDIGLPEPEAQSIATSFLESAQAEGHEQPEGASEIGVTVAIVILGAILVALGVGIYTIATSITAEILAVGLGLVLLWILPAILLLRWWDRRRARR